MLSRAFGLVSRAAFQALSSTGAVQQATAATSVSLSHLLQARGFATNSTDVFNIHKDTAENNATTEFDFTPVRSALCLCVSLPVSINLVGKS